MTRNKFTERHYQDAALDRSPPPQTRARHSSHQRRVLDNTSGAFKRVVGFVASCFRRAEQERSAFQNLMALDAVTLRDIGLDRPRAIALPNSL